jgi:hypothetical protein
MNSSTRFGMSAQPEETPPYRGKLEMVLNFSAATFTVKESSYYWNGGEGPQLTGPNMPNEHDCIKLRNWKHS